MEILIIKIQRKWKRYRNWTNNYSSSIERKIFYSV